MFAPQTPARDALLVLRLGEIFLKGDNRPYFMRRLKANIEAGLASFSQARLSYVHGRYLIKHPKELTEPLLRQMTKVFGLSSVSPAVEVEKNLDAITAAALDLVSEPGVLEGKKTFAVKAHRSDKLFPHTSPEIGRVVGDAVGRVIGLDVDLKNPDLKLEVEVGPKATFVFVRRLKGAGGLPVGVSGKVVLLLSAGIDSPVAGWLMMKRGVAIEALTFHSPPFTDEAALEKAVRLSQKMASWAGPFTLRAARFTEVQKKLHREAPDDLGVLLYRRMMMRTANELARIVGASAIITGESLGQVASQTMENMSRIEEASSLPVLRPLIGFDKQEIIQKARQLNTYAISIEPHIDSCSLFTPKHPVTRARKKDVERAEAQVDLNLTHAGASLAHEAEVIEIRPPVFCSTAR